MRIRQCCMLLFITAAGCLFAAEAGVQPSASYEKYKLVYERNIFSRMRYTPLGQSAPGQTRMEKVVLSLYVLRGVAVENTNRLAFVEDEISGQSKRLGVGAELLNGTIDQIHIDHVLFTQKDQARTIRIGEEFDRVESEVERPVETAQTTSDPNAASPVPQDKKAEPAAPQDENAILKKLMERRKQELQN